MSMPGDIDLGSGNSYWGANLTAFVENGTIAEARLDDMAERIVSACFLGQDDNSPAGEGFLFPGIRMSEYRIPRLAVYDYGHGCEKGFSPFRENPFSVVESGSMPLGVSRCPSSASGPYLPVQSVDHG